MFHQALTCHAGNREREVEVLRQLGPGIVELEEGLTLSHGFSGLLFRHMSRQHRDVLGYTLLTVRPLTQAEAEAHYG